MSNADEVVLILHAALPRGADLHLALTMEKGVWQRRVSARADRFNRMDHDGTVVAEAAGAGWRLALE